MASSLGAANANASSCWSIFKSRSFFSWDELLSRPGLSHLATEIFIGLDLDTLASAEQVCRSWRNHIATKEFWREKVAKSRQFDLKLARHLADLKLFDKDDKDDLARLCRSVCSNEAWFNSETNHENWFRRSVGAFEKKGFLAARDKYVWLDSGPTLKTARCIFDKKKISLEEKCSEHLPLNRHEFVTCFDVNSGGNLVALGTNQGCLLLYDLASGFYVCEGDAGAYIWVLKFHPSDKFIATIQGRQGLVKTWAHRSRGHMSLCQTLDRICPGDDGKPKYSSNNVDVSWDYLMMHNAKQIMVFVSIGEGIFAKQFELEADENVGQVVGLRSEPGIAVSLGSSQSLKVWNLRKGKLLHEVMMKDSPVAMSECSENGILAVCCQGGPDMVANSVGILPTAGLRQGLAASAMTYIPIHRSFISAYRNDFGTIVAKKDKIYIFWLWELAPRGLILAGAIVPGAAKSLA